MPLWDTHDVTWSGSSRFKDRNVPKQARPSHMHHLSSNCWPWDIQGPGTRRANRGFMRHTQRRQALPFQAALLPRDSPNREAQLRRRHGMRAEEHKLAEAAPPSATQLAQLEGRAALKAPVRALFVNR